MSSGLRPSGNIDEDKCSAEFKDGVLTLTLPKSAEKARGRKIQLGQDKQRDTRAEDSLIESGNLLWYGRKIYAVLKEYT